MLLGDKDMSKLGDILLEEATSVYERYPFYKRWYKKTEKLCIAIVKRSKPSNNALPVSWPTRLLLRLMSSRKRQK
jgi:hypothetical protein